MLMTRCMLLFVQHHRNSLLLMMKDEHIRVSGCDMRRSGSMVGLSPFKIMRAAE
jgi:hypothetical protein